MIAWLRAFVRTVRTNDKMLTKLYARVDKLTAQVEELQTRRGYNAAAEVDALTRKVNQLLQREKKR